MVLSRVFAAVLGGYGLTALCAVSLTQLLSTVTTRFEAVVAATMLGVVVQLGACLSAFTARTPIRAWIYVGIPILVAGGTALVFRQ